MGGDSERARAKVEGDVRKASGVQARNYRLCGYRRIGAADVKNGMQPKMSNVEDEEEATGTKDAEHFGEHVVLELGRFQMM